MSYVRITNSMLTNNFLVNLNKNLNNMSKLQSQMAANSKIVNIADDPVGVIASMRARGGLRDIEGFTTNTNDARAWLNATEDAFRSLNEVIKSAYETAVNMASDPGNAGSATGISTTTGREAVMPYIEQLREEVYQIANSKVGDKYLFGGFNTTTQPFTTEFEEEDPLMHWVQDEDGEWVQEQMIGMDYSEDPPEEYEMVRDVPKLVYNGMRFEDRTEDKDGSDYLDEVAQHIEYTVGFGYQTKVNYTGLELMNVQGVYQINREEVSEESKEVVDKITIEPFEKNIFQIFDDFYVALLNDDQEGLSRSIEELQTAQDHVMNLQADIGGRTTRLDMVEARNENSEYTYTVMKSDVEDIDLAEAVMWYKMAESVYNAALSSGASIIQPSLMDYLR